jgi:hypothetical protein
LQMMNNTATRDLLKQVRANIDNVFLGMLHCQEIDLC